MRVAVVGAGIAGLTCALRLREADHEVEVMAAAPTLRTTSAVAAALWYPYRALPQREVTRWAGTTYEVLAGLVDEPGAADLPAGYADGLRLTVPVVDTSVHLPWLLGRLGRIGVSMRTATLARLEDAAPDADVVVNCAGLGARELLDDAGLLPVRGQVVVVEQVGVTEWLLAQSDPALLTYVVPRERTVVLGGTAQEGREDVAPEPQTATAVLRRCTELVPELAGARVLEHKVGLRPTRPAVRLEAGRLASGQRVVHDYGHGGAGVTLSYGCAQDVAALVDAG